ncbi:SatD family (SatD) [Butyrivibrio fibrisolvens DSM 3071]|uniref:SatD family (SatD) n=1 Tax=Butyrivibrio fibrisolvens DSM 3071 TaxID=1121131 RepID=A0A1M5ZD93_BUTFI|nr:SatD family protein [Butyrivibrio fibrisolvens]SHI22187.1 SatD family (SatD) [Butyrivibrio fibrisolvens DSM 3071]
MKYIAIIGDIRYSKQISNRGAIQSKLNKVLKSINDNYKEDIAANFLITLGDEFQGLLTSTEHLLEIIRYIQMSMYPVEIRFGLGCGKITTKINKEAAIGADGPAFYAARNMIEQLKHEEKKLKQQASDVKLSVYEKDDTLQVEQLNTFFRVNKLLENKWSTEQRNTIMEMKYHKGSQEEIARRLDTTQATVARRLVAGSYLTYEEVERVINLTLGNIKL